jgi:L-galactose dehydrogenase/L-glyceraldehyde 3-phosphate reductase
MDYRTLGKTGLRVSALGFGCGNVGGLMVRGTPADQQRAVARAIELGINYFDTAPVYGEGRSETNLGRVLKTLGADVVVGTKFRLPPSDRGLPRPDRATIAAAIRRSLDGSLRRLGMERVDLLQCHEHIAPDAAGGALPLETLCDLVVPVLAELRDEGKIRFWGITALGDTGALHEALGSGAAHTAQVCLNLLNPSAAVDVPPRFPAQDFGRLLDRARATGTGTIVIRVAAAGALSGVLDRHPVAVPVVAPIASGPEYAVDVTRARALAALVDEGHASSLIEASMRFALASDAVSTVLLGYSSLEHLETAAAAVARGPLPEAALTRLQALWKDVAARP